MSEPTAPDAPVADVKDWTWVTQRQCPECGFDPATVEREDLPESILGAAERFEVAVEEKGAEERPARQVWSPIEYGQHVADVLELMTERLREILDGEGDVVEFEDWDQDAAAVEKEYWKANGHATAVLIHERAEGAANLWAQVAEDEWGWSGVRSDGAEFSAETLGRYLAHELIHHLHDVSG